MRYWKGLMIAAAIDFAWIAAHPSPVGPRVEGASVVDVVDVAQAREVDDLQIMDNLVDSLMLQVQDQPGDVDAIQRLAELYADHGWWNEAIGPLARALQLNSSRRSLWTALDRAVAGSGRDKITDAELTRRAAQFVEDVEMWGRGC